MSPYNYQTGGRRFLALIIDGFILSMATGLIEWCMTPSLGVLPNVVLCVLFTAVQVGYEVYMHGRFGQTFGKFFVKVRVIDLGGRRITYKQAAVRNIVPLVLSPIVIWYSVSIVVTGEMQDPSLYRSAYIANLLWVLLEMLTMLLNDKRRALHDFMANTVVVRVT
jgi:uncharacterized RDD family membrane protein YckC